MRIAFHTLGCKVNQYETEKLRECFKCKGYEICTEDGVADIYVINTCTVTGLADRKSRQYIRRAKKINPDSIVAVTGCYAQMNPKEISEIDGVDIVIGNENKMDIYELLEQFVNEKEYNNDFWVSTKDFHKSTTESRTRTLIKVQDGCNRFCSYCVIPYARGEVRSRSPESIINEAKALIADGFKELVLTGINTALYGTEAGFSGENGIEALVGRLDGLAGDFRIRLSSLEPTVIDADYVEKLFRYEKLCHHIHLSVQSGSDRILQSMSRKYTIAEYMSIVSKLRDFDQHYGISTDIIAGFPGESEDDFNGSIKLLKQVDFCKTHVFKYSNRNGTVASEMGGQLSGGEKNRRSAALICEGELSAQRFFEGISDEAARVLIEEYIEDIDCYTGYSGNYVKVYIKNEAGSSNIFLNRFLDVRLTKPYRDGMSGEKI